MLVAAPLQVGGWTPDSRPSSTSTSRSLLLVVCVWVFMMLSCAEDYYVQPALNLPLFPFINLALLLAR